MTYRQRMRIVGQFKAGMPVWRLRILWQCDGATIESAIRHVLLTTERTGRPPREYLRALAIEQRKSRKHTQ